MQALAPWSVNGELRVRDERITKVEVTVDASAGQQH
jgi:hypothetical protein